MQIIAENRKARYDYEFLDEIEAGVVLTGQEVKSAKRGGLRLRGAYAIAREGALWLVGAHIVPWKTAGALSGYDPERTRKLLVHKKEVQKILGRQSGEKLTLVPKNAYTRAGRIKIAVVIARSKRAFEKREAIRRRESERETSRELKRRGSVR
jgi:SsrA-binding protein